MVDQPRPVRRKDQRRQDARAILDEQQQRERVIDALRQQPALFHAQRIHALMERRGENPRSVRLGRWNGQ